MDILGTTIILISNVSEQDPLQWNYKTYNVEVPDSDPTVVT
jgi:hypothetical protein